MNFSVSVPLILGNWKMHKTVEEALAFEQGLLSHLNSQSLQGPQVGIAAPFTALFPMSEKAKGTRLFIGAQNMNDVEEGAFTGEIAARMLVEAGVRFVILGHSERRRFFGESSAFISKKVKKALAAHLLPVVCVGETQEEKEEGRTEEIITSQLRESFQGVDDPKDTCIAYEPVWAIGSHKNAEPEDAASVHKMIRSVLSELFGEEQGNKIPLLYGGSVRPDNAALFLKNKEIQGLLVGGASLSLDQFIAVIAAGVH